MSASRRAVTVAAAFGLALSLSACGGSSDDAASGESVVKTALESGNGTGWCGGESGTGNFAYSGVEVTETSTEGTFEWQDSNGFRGKAYVNLEEGCVTSAQVATG